MGSRKETRNEGGARTGWRNRKDSGKMRRKKMIHPCKGIYSTQRKADEVE